MKIYVNLKEDFDICRILHYNVVDIYELAIFCGTADGLEYIWTDL